MLTLEDTLWLMSILVAFVFCAVIVYRHTPRKRLSKEEIEKIKENGVIHFTTEENAKAIVEEGLTPSSKTAMSRSERDMVWLFINDKAEEKFAYLTKQKPRRHYDSVVIFTGVSEAQLSNMRIRRGKVNVLCIKGPFSTTSVKYEKMK